MNKALYKEAVLVIGFLIIALQLVVEKINEGLTGWDLVIAIGTGLLLLVARSKVWSGSSLAAVLKQIIDAMQNDGVSADEAIRRTGYTPNELLGSNTAVKLTQD